ncbi:MAG: hypothetical protein QM605_09315 [Sphingobium sp.]
MKAEDISLFAQTLQAVEAGGGRQSASICQFLIGDPTLLLDQFENSAIGDRDHISFSKLSDLLTDDHVLTVKSKENSPGSGKANGSSSGCARIAIGIVFVECGDVCRDGRRVKVIAKTSCRAIAPDAQGRRRFQNQEMVPVR